MIANFFPESSASFASTPPIAHPFVVRMPIIMSGARDARHPCGIAAR